MEAVSTAPSDAPDVGRPPPRGRLQVRARLKGPGCRSSI